MGCAMGHQTQPRKTSFSEATAGYVPAHGGSIGDWKDGGNDLVRDERQMQS